MKAQHATLEGATCMKKRTLQQDGAPSHTARNTIAYLRRDDVAFIDPDSRDLNPLDYDI